MVLLFWLRAVELPLKVPQKDRSNLQIICISKLMAESWRRTLGRDTFFATKS